VKEGENIKYQRPKGMENSKLGIIFKLVNRAYWSLMIQVVA